MKYFGQYIDEAIPHEAGHILVGRVVGLHARGLDVEVVRQPDGRGISVGNFATLAFSPPDEEIPNMNPKLKASYMLFISAGVAGNRFAGLKTPCQGADSDRKELARITDRSLEEIAEMPMQIIQSHKRAFRQLVSLIRRRFTERIWKNLNVPAGRVNLISQEDLDNLFSEYTSAASEQENTFA
jgi:hypothetical protein